MFSINCKLLQQILCDIRRSLGIRKSSFHPVTIRVGRESTIVRVTTKEASIACQIPGGRGKPETIALPMQSLAGLRCSPKSDINFGSVDAGVRVGWWQDGQEVFETLEGLELVDDANLAPEWLLSNHRRLGKSLSQAAWLTDPDSSRYSLGCIQLRGRDGQIAATDGRQAFSQSGFSFPVDEVLVPAGPLKHLRCLDRCSSISIGRSNEWISLRMAVGPLRWLVDLKITSHGRFPNVDQCMPGDNSTRCELTIADSDAEFLQSHLAKLLGKSSDIQPLTIDLGRDRMTSQQQVVLRFRGCRAALADLHVNGSDINVLDSTEGQRPDAAAQPSFRSACDSSSSSCPQIELVLDRSHYDQLPARLVMDYRHLLTALKLGFRRVRFGTDSSPAWCVDGDRRYVWALLDRGQIPSASPHAAVLSTRRDLVAA